MTRNDIHTCSYSCERPACIKAQRDELVQKLPKLVAEAVAAEREACAKVCEETRFPDSYTAIRCAAAIRARGGMTRDDIERMAVEAGGFIPEWRGIWELSGDALQRFAALVAAAEREKVAAWMHFNDYTTGHGDCIEDLLEEIQAQVAESERWKCAEIAEAYEPRCDVCPKGVANAIRARGEA